MYEKRRMHPATVVFNFFRLIKDFFIPILISFFTLGTEGMEYFLIIVAIVLILFIPYSILSWYRFTYEVTEDELIVEHGILIKRKRYISKNRIHSIDLTQNILHRFLQLVKVQIETAGSGDGAEVFLKAIDLKDGEMLREHLKQTQEEESKTSDENAPPNPQDQITARRLFITGTTSGSLGLLLAISGFFFSQIEQLIPENFVDETFRWVIGLSAMLLVGFIILFLLFLWVLGIAGTMIKYGNFTITKQGDELFITRGLLEKKQITLPLDRIQAVGIDESIFRQPFGYATVYVEVAGGVLDGTSDFTTVLFPLLKKEEIEQFLGKYLSAYKDVNELKMKRPPTKSLFYYEGRVLIPVIIIAFFNYWLFPGVFYVSGILFLLAALYGWMQFRDSGFKIDSDRVTIRYRRGLTRSTIRVFRYRIQAMEVKQHKLHQFQRLATVQLSILATAGNGKHFTANEMNGEDVEHLFTWYSRRKTIGISS